jgi:hypothetical protein
MFGRPSRRLAPIATGVRKRMARQANGRSNRDDLPIGSISVRA